MPKIEKFINKICSNIFEKGQDFLPKGKLNPNDVPNIIQYWIENYLETSKMISFILNHKHIKNVKDIPKQVFYYFIYI